jgi:FlaA1/EpsC-like NDP-sugar epimerase
MLMIRRIFLKLLKKTKKLFLIGTTPRWLIFSTDVILTALAVFIAFELRLNFHFGKAYYSIFLFSELLFLNVRIACFSFLRISSHIIRYTNLQDLRRIFFTVGLGSVILLAISFIARITHAYPAIPLSVIAIEFFITLYLMVNLRLGAKYIYSLILSYEMASKKVLIYGTKELAVLAREALELNPTKKYRVQAFIDSVDHGKKNKLMGLTIFDIKQIKNLIDKFSITHVVFAKENIGENEREYIAGICMRQEVKMLTIPDSWLDGNLSKNEIKEVKIEDILNRKPIKLNQEHIEEALIGKTILVTGAAGSIGSEIVRQIVNYNPMRIVLIDQAESPLYDIELEMREEYKATNFDIILADITDKDRIDKIFELTKPQIVYHAAAYKHVPMMESHPTEAIRNNVFGSKILADLAHKHKVKKFIMVSTDKAVNPTGIMGATKRISEMYIQSLNNLSETNFITTRFGNVLYSNGSVLHRFLKQIKQGGPVTVTHPEITRFFMTIPEACQLVLEASVMGKGGEIYLFDMGKAVKILDLAKNLIKFAGQAVDKDIKIKFTGLRPGEKLYEELLLESENNIPTHHPKIKIAEVCQYEYFEINSKIEALGEPLRQQNILKMVKMMKEIVPTYKSQNSVYEKLDTAS